MGVSVFPAASTAATPGATNKPPKFTYNNSYNLSSLSGMNSITSSSTAMAYRRTDGCIYFTSSGHTNLWKFDTSTNTGSYVSNTVSWTGAKDIVCAYDGTLYASLSDTGTASIETPQYSTNGGATWTYLTNSTVGAYRGFMALIDAGEIPGHSGNIVHLHSGSSSGGDGASWWEGTTKASTSIAGTVMSVFSTSSGGRAVFPLRDGDDVKTGTRGIWMGPIAGGAFGVDRTSNGVAIRPASYASRSIGTDKGIYFSYHPNVVAFNSTSSVYVENTFKINKPTTIDSRWIVGANASNPHELNVIDFQTLKNVSNVPLPFISDVNAYAYGPSNSNPIYVSATKKLYVLSANGTGSANYSSMHVYDVTTY